MKGNAIKGLFSVSFLLLALTAVPQKKKDNQTKVVNNHNLIVSAMIKKNTGDGTKESFYLLQGEPKVTRILIPRNSFKDYTIHFFFDSVAFRRNIEYCVKILVEVKNIRRMEEEAFHLFDSIVTNGNIRRLQQMFQLNEYPYPKSIHEWVTEHLDSLDVEGLHRLIYTRLTLEQLNIVASSASYYSDKLIVPRVKYLADRSIATFKKGYQKSEKYKKHVPVSFSAELEVSVPALSFLSYLSSKNVDHSKTKFYNSVPEIMPVNLRFLPYFRNGENKDNLVSGRIYFPFFINKSSLIYSDNSNDVFRPNIGYSFLNTGIGIGIDLTSERINLPKTRKDRFGIMFDMGVSMIYVKEHEYSLNASTPAVRGSSDFKKFGNPRLNINIGPYLDFNFFRLKADWFVSPEIGDKENNGIYWSNLNFGLIVPIYRYRSF